VKQVTAEVVLKEVKTQKKKETVANHVKADKHSSFLDSADV
jgi:hypothetical protein